MHILNIVANPMPPEESVDKRLTARFLESLGEAAPDATITTVDLYQSRPPFFDHQTYRYLWYGFREPGYEPSPEEQAAISGAHLVVSEDEPLVPKEDVW